MLIVHRFENGKKAQEIGMIDTEKARLVAYRYQFSKNMSSKMILKKSMFHYTNNYQALPHEYVYNLYIS
jgi:hypothetical protein